MRPGDLLNFGILVLLRTICVSAALIGRKLPKYQGSRQILFTIT